MCDYCSCRNIEVIRNLSADHVLIQDMAYDMKKAIERGDYATAEAIRSGDDESEKPERRIGFAGFLALHAFVEENGLYPLLANDYGLEQNVESLTAEHRGAEEVFGQEITDEASGANVLDELRILAKHIEQEEYDEFPWAMQEVEPRKWEGVEAEIQAALDGLAAFCSA